LAGRFLVKKKHAVKGQPQNKGGYDRCEDQLIGRKTGHGANTGSKIQGFKGQKGEVFFPTGFPEP
jgi:hypothetical protein